jgi:predicted lipoprotein with Yx(FWY)xxD motif
MRPTLVIALTLALVAALPVGSSLADMRQRPAAAPAAVASGQAHTAARGITITTRKVGRFGTILVDGRGMPLYSFTRDKGTSSRCYGACAAAWPVTYAKGTPIARGGAKASLLGRQRRKDGRFQVTYAGKALYYYVDDRPGVALCHNVREFGGLWLLERANGRSV